MLFNTLKVIHIFSMVAWMAGLFYFPILFVYHAENRSKSRDNNIIFKVMEYKLLHYITIPAMIGTWIFGIILVSFSYPEIFREVWFIIKFLCVVVLTAFNIWCIKVVNQFCRDENNQSGRFFRFINEVPTIMLVFIVLCVVIKPI